MPADVFYTPLQVNSVPFLILNPWNESLLLSRNYTMKLAKARCRRLNFPRTLASLLTYVTSSFQRDQNFHTSVVPLAQLEGPAWPFSYCPVGIPFDIGGNPRAECENRTRSWPLGLLDLWVGSQREQMPAKTGSLILTKTSVPARLAAARSKNFLC